MTTPETADRIRKRASETLSEERLAHVKRVADLSVDLCRRFGVETERGRLAAWAHDLAREWRTDELMRWATLDDEPLTEFEKTHPKLLHGRAAAVVLSREHDVSDADVLNAVRHHTLGRPGMSPLEMIIYVADYFEPGRGFLSEPLRSVLSADRLEQMVVAAVDDLAARGLSIAGATRRMYDELLKRMNE